MISRVHRICNFFFLIIFFYLIFSSAACVKDNYLNKNPDALTGDGILSWPPHDPRIQLIKTIRSPADLGIQNSWFRKAVNTILGREEYGEQMLRPYGIFADSEIIYVTDPGVACIHIFDVKRKKYSRICEIDGEALMSPIGITVNAKGQIFLSDSVLKNVFVFDREGKYLRSIVPPDGFIRPTGIAIDEDRIYVVDTHRHQVFVFSQSTGLYLFRFGTHGSAKGEFNYPTNIFFGKDNLLYILDSMNFRVQIFNREGEFISSFGKLGDGSGNFSKPKGVAVDSEGNIYITDANFDIVQIFDRNGKLLLWFGSSGSGNGDFFIPAGIFIDSKDRVYIADSYNNRIQIFQYLKRQK